MSEKLYKLKAEIERLKEAFGVEDLAAYEKDGFTPFERYRQQLRHDLREKLHAYGTELDKIHETIPINHPAKRAVSKLREGIREDMFTLYSGVNRTKTPTIPNAK